MIPEFLTAPKVYSSYTSAVTMDINADVCNTEESPTERIWQLIYRGFRPISSPIWIHPAVRVTPQS